MISLLLLFLARALKGFSDIVKSNWKSTFFSTWQPTTKFRKFFLKWAGPGSQLRKWKRDENGNPIPNTKRPWYYLYLYKPKYVEEFMFSSTFGVTFRDAWHTSEGFRRTINLLAIVLWSVHTAGFTIPGMEIPNLVSMLLNNLLGHHTWFPLTSLIVNAVALGTAVQLIGFTTFYDYILRRRG